MLDTQSFAVQERFFETEPGVQVLVHSQRPREAAAGELILVHGLEGSSDAGYARSLAQAGLEGGYAVHRYNMRSCGGTEAVCGPTLYHSGQISDLLVVIRALALEASAPIYLVGFSLGGNVVLKLAGELGAEGRDLLAGVCAVSTPIDLAACVRELDRPANAIYARRFLDRLKKRIRRKESLTPGLFNVSLLPEIRSVYQFDDEYTARSFGFGTAANYYATQSAQRFLSAIRVPTLLIQAKDDPLIPFAVYDHPAFRENPNLTLLAPEHGGHLGFLSRRGRRFWVDGVILEWISDLGNRAAARPVTTSSAR